MTQFLASVRDSFEAEIALGVSTDIIDLKEPSRGALGAVDGETIEMIVRSIAGRASVSATIGDLPMHPETIRDAVLETAARGVDYVKVGLFPEGDPQGCLEMLPTEARGVRLIVVLFADRLPDFDAVAAAARIVACGVMLDTADKRSGSLLDHLGMDALDRFVTAAKANGLSVGLAGSLKREHVPELLPLKPDLLGFRGALCRGAARGASLDPAACRLIRRLIPKTQLPKPQRALDAEPRASLQNAATEALC
jgi:(5-formylfuran-3-yl)methyl phosphate synthase